MAHRVSKPTTAYVLINCEPGTQTVVIDEQYLKLWKPTKYTALYTTY